MDSIQIHTESFGITANYLRILNNFLHSNTLRIFVPEKIKKKKQMLCKPATVMLPPATASLHRASSYPPIPLNKYRDTGPLSYVLLPTLPTEKPDMSFSSRIGTELLWPLSPSLRPASTTCSRACIHTSVRAAIYILVHTNTPQPGALSNNGLVLHPQ